MQTRNRFAAHRLCLAAAVAFAWSLLPLTAQALTVITFDTPSAGIVPSYTDSGVTFTRGPGANPGLEDLEVTGGILFPRTNFVVGNGSVGFEAVIAGGASLVSIDMLCPSVAGLLGCAYALQAFDSASNLVDSQFVGQSPLSGSTLTVTGDIAFVRFRAATTLATFSPDSGSYETFSFEPNPIPEPGAAALFGLGSWIVVAATRLERG